MRNLKTVCCLAALLIAPTFATPFVPFAPARVWAQDATSPAQKWLTHTYAAIDKSIAVKDADAIIAWQADDFVSINQAGETKTRDETNQNMKQLFAQLPAFENVTTTAENIETAENGSVSALVTLTLKTNIKGPEDKTIALEIKTRSRDVWTPNADKTAYKMQTSTELETAATADGMPIPLG